MEPIVEGKEVKAIQGVDPEQVLIYHDKVTAGNGEKEEILKAKESIMISPVLSLSS